ncbi:MAG: sterol desaturase family protein [Candidatus Dormibacteraeota bacterium]|uniref:Sterol desaturase family protein n=1 Tax=Candidatus Aeolococcus gillhamiae TaxID=3127015 RepID=A0A934K013_9BACT|nr:sterol desaturase family protein [Candidatus Dormibacteraeota bacterium]
MRNLGGGSAGAASVGEAVTAGRGTLGLGGAARIFFEYGSPRLMAIAAGVAVVARMLVGHLPWADLVVVGAILAVEPFAEWLLHVFVLHFKPRTIGSRRLDPLFAKRHRMHHRDPRNIPLVFVPLPVLAGFFVLLAAVGGLGFPDHRLGLTAFATMTTFLLGYEWSHYLIHSPYVPRTAAFRAVWRAHTLHHYKNEQYWFGVTNPVADYVLRTHPAKNAVPTSPTARTLGVDDELTLLTAPA